MSLRRIGRLSISNPQKKTISSQKKTTSLLTASGVPGTPTSVSASATSSNAATITWTAPSFVGESAITSYTVTGSGSVSVAGTTGTVTGLTASSYYTFSLAANNAVGRGAVVSVSLYTGNFNGATGGTITTFTSTGEPGTITGGIYRLHSFRSSGTFTPTASTLPLDVILVGGGAPSSRNGTVRFGRAGGGGAGSQYSLTLTNGTNYVMSPGAAIGGADLTDPPAGNSTSGFGYTVSGGGACSAGNNNGGGGWGQTLTFDGTGSQGYGRNGVQNSAGTQSKYGGGGGNVTVVNGGGVASDSGCVLVRYQIG